MGLNFYLIIFLSFFIFVVLLLVFVYFAFRTSSQKSNFLKGTRIFKLDLYSRKVSSIDPSNQQKDIFKFPKHKDGSVSLKRLMMFFEGNQKVNKLFREAINDLSENKKQEVDFTFKHKIMSKSIGYLRGVEKIQFDFKIKKIIETDDCILVIKWMPIAKEKKERKFIKYISKDDVISNFSKYKSFIAFNLNNEEQDSSSKLIELFRNLFNQNIEYFKNKNTLIIFFHGNKVQKVNKKMHRFIYKVNKKGPQYGAKILFKGAGYITLHEVDTLKKLSQAIKALNFFITLSIAQNKTFVSNQEEGFNTKEYEAYTNASKLFFKNIKEEKIETKYIPIRSFSSNRKVLSYAYPVIKGINDNMLSYLLTNSNNKSKLFDEHAKKIAINKKINDPVLVDVNSNWLIQNAKALTYKKAIYCINMTEDSSYEDLKMCIDYLENHGFIFAMKIKVFDERVSLLIKTTQPKFIIIDKSIWGETASSNSNTFINLLTIKKFCDAEKIKLIYEDPKTFLDKEGAEKIGLQYMYKYE